MSMLQKNIQKRQNEEELLKCQYVSRYYYNAGELYNFLTWIFVFIPVLFLFLPTSENKVLLSIPFISELLASWFIHQTNVAVRKASKLRRYFDSYVLELNYSSFTDLEKLNIREIITKIADCRVNECNVQINHSGKEKPPGVRDWYEFAHDYSDEEVQFECQKRNCWWTEKMFLSKVFIYVLLAISLIIAFIIVERYISIDDLFSIVICCAGIFLRILERMTVNFQCFVLAIEIRGVLKLCNSCNIPNNILHLQEKIDELRAMPVFGINFVHKHLAPKLSVLYKKIS